ncbi:MAG: anti-sigma factor [bacterium]|nr:anti-sigma factor [bacterium]
MMLEELKNSGLLELYVLKACTPEEELLVAEMLQKHPALLAELDQNQMALAQYAELFSVEPPADLEGKIKAKLQFKPAAKTVSLKPNEPNIAKNIGIYQWLLAASVVVIAGLSVALNFSVNKLNEVESSLLALQSEKILLSDKFDQASFKFNKQEAQWIKVQQLEYTQVALAGTANYPDAKLKVYWNKKSKETFVSIINMPKLAEGKQFQLWSLVNGKPINAGVFDAAFGTLFLSNIATMDAQLFAVTIENKGGSESPTLANMVVAGEVAL